MYVYLSMHGWDWLPCDNYRELGITVEQLYEHSAWIDSHISTWEGWLSMKLQKLWAQSEELKAKDKVMRLRLLRDSCV